MAKFSPDEIESRVKITEGSTPDLYNELSKIAQKSRSGRIRSLAEKGLLFEKLLESGDLSNALNVSNKAASNSPSTDVSADDLNIDKDTDNSKVDISGSVSDDVVSNDSVGQNEEKTNSMSQKAESEGAKNESESSHYTMTKNTPRAVPKKKLTLGSLGVKR